MSMGNCRAIIKVLAHNKIEIVEGKEGWGLQVPGHRFRWLWDRSFMQVPV